MNNRERFMRLMNFQKVDKIPCISDFFLSSFNTMPEGTVTANRWHLEGLPIWNSAQDYFDVSFKPEAVPVNLGMIPPFIIETLYEDDQYVIRSDYDGVVKRIFKRRSALGALQNWGMPQFLKFPVENRGDWEQIRKRYSPEDPRRLSISWCDELIEYYEKTDNPVAVPISILFGWVRSLMGLENFLKALYKDPGLIHDMMEFRAQFTIQALEPIVEKCRIDFAVLCTEDMAYRKGPLMSPKHIKELMVPNYKVQTDFLRKHGIDLTLWDSDGDVRLIIPLLLESGINGVWPLEVRAGNDAVELRKKYPRLRMIGNIDKFALIEGKEAIDKELEYKLPFLLKQGGYLPAVDHGIPPEVPFEHYRYYMQRLREYLDAYS